MSYMSEKRNAFKQMSLFHKGDREQELTSPVRKSVPAWFSGEATRRQLLRRERKME